MNARRERVQQLVFTVFTSTGTRVHGCAGFVLGVADG